MGIGAGIFLIVAGAILSFGVQDSVDAVNLTYIGYILMGAGVLGLLLSFIVLNKKRTTTSTVSEQVTGNAPTERTITSEVR